MRIHLITNLFAPDELAGAALFSDLAIFLKERDHDVRVTCCFPYYPTWKLRPEDVGVPFRDETFEGIPVRRVSMRVPSRPTGKGRLVADLSYFWSLLRRGRHPGWSPEVVITAIPMLSQALAQRFLYPNRSIPRLIVVQDFVVEAALELGILSLPGIAPVLHAAQRWALRSAATLTTISPPMLEKLQRIVGSGYRTRMIPNWIHGSLQREIERQRLRFRERQRARLFYAGNLGVKQGLPDFLPIFAKAQELLFRREIRSWTLKIHGGGAERDRLADVASQTPGCLLGGVLEEADYVAELGTATACLVTQRPGVGANFLPSKLLPALATGTPVLAVCERSSPLAEAVLRGGFGEVIPPGDVEVLALTLARWAGDFECLARMSVQALELSRRYCREEVLAQYEGEVARLVVR